MFIILFFPELINELHKTVEEVDHLVKYEKSRAGRFEF